MKRIIQTYAFYIFKIVKKCLNMAKHEKNLKAQI